MLLKAETQRQGLKPQVGHRNRDLIKPQHHGHKNWIFMKTEIQTPLCETVFLKRRWLEVLRVTKNNEGVPWG